VVRALQGDGAGPGGDRPRVRGPRARRQANVEENDEVPFEYGITAMPTLIVIKEGRVVDERVGKQSRAQLVKLLDDSIA
jgi:hypothetical protein